MTARDLWLRYQQYLCTVPSLELTLDISRVAFPADYFDRMAAPIERAFAEMAELEGGAIANRDEQRMVGHYWLRAPERAPAADLRQAITAGIEQIDTFATAVHHGQTAPPTADRFTRVLCIGIGGSALGPMFLADALGDPTSDRLVPHFLDNTDPDGIARELHRLAGRLGETLVIVTSKSGGTPETRNGMVLVQAAYRAAGLDFGPHAVAITMPDSALDRTAIAEQWRARFPMFDWVGGRTSVLSAVGLLPAALQGLDIRELLAGAAACDEATRVPVTRRNPSALLALMWHHATSGRGRRDMVVLPYKDRLLLFSRYLQQLIMESLGKQFDRDGRRVEQGLTVYGNKGSTDQHAYVQQLRDGLDNFFVTFVRVLESGGTAAEVESQATAGDFLHGFLLGTRTALADNARESMTITIPRVDARRVGALIALFERAVGLYASLVNVNAYHQPGVEAGKKAAAGVLALQRQLLAALSATPQTAEQLAAAIGNRDAVEAVYLILEHLTANGRARMAAAATPATTTFTRAG